MNCEVPSFASEPIDYESNDSMVIGDMKEAQLLSDKNGYFLEK